MGEEQASRTRAAGGGQSRQAERRAEEGLGEGAGKGGMSVAPVIMWLDARPSSPSFPLTGFVKESQRIGSGGKK